MRGGDHRREGLDLKQLPVNSLPQFEEIEGELAANLNALCRSAVNQHDELLAALTC
jgi:hypothetical protein